MKYNLIIFCTCLFLIFGMNDIYAQNLSEQTGTVVINPRYDNKSVVGGNLIIYKIATKSKDKAISKYEISKDFSNVDINFDKESLEKNNREYAKRLVEFTNAVTPYMSIEDITEEGVKIEGLEEGVYLFVQTESADGYELISPFLLTIPKDGNFNINAIEKMSPIKNVDENGKEIISKHKDKADEKIRNKKIKGEDDSNDDEKKKENPIVPNGNNDDINKLPQTGQVWWPVYLLANIGLVLIGISFIKVRRNNA